jgi:hypothetical protein
VYGIRLVLGRRATPGDAPARSFLTEEVVRAGPESAIERVEESACIPLATAPAEDATASSLSVDRLLPLLSSLDPPQLLRCLSCPRSTVTATHLDDPRSRWRSLPSAAPLKLLPLRLVASLAVRLPCGSADEVQTGPWVLK